MAASGGRRDGAAWLGTMVPAALAGAGIDRARIRRPTLLEAGLLFAALIVLGRYLVCFALNAPSIGIDLGLYQQAAQHWLVTGKLYPASQVAGPYMDWSRAILYPPASVALFLPTLLLPLPIWWAIPIVASSWAVWRMRPAPWAWALVLVCLWPDHSVELVLAGNPTMWLVACLTLAITWRPLAALIFLKPSLFPFALFGVRSRGWWIVAAAIGAANVALWPELIDWLRVIQNGQGPRSGLFYSLGDVPLMLIPLVAWLGRTAPGRMWATPARTILTLRVPGALRLAERPPRGDGGVTLPQAAMPQLGNGARSE